MRDVVDAQQMLSRLRKACKLQRVKVLGAQREIGAESLDERDSLVLLDNVLVPSKGNCTGKRVEIWREMKLKGRYQAARNTHLQPHYPSRLSNPSPSRRGRLLDTQSSSGTETNVVCPEGPFHLGHAGCFRQTQLFETSLRANVFAASVISFEREMGGLEGGAVRGKIQDGLLDLARRQTNDVEWSAGGVLSTNVF